MGDRRDLRDPGPSLDAPPGNVLCYAHLGRQGLARNQEMGQ